jgi:succinyl-CoA synthetase beta subunit
MDAANDVSIKVPLVVRLEGTNAEEARQMLADSGLNLVVARTMWEGAQKIVSLIQA